MSVLIESINNTKSNLSELSSEVKKTQSQHNQNLENKFLQKRKVRFRDRSNSRKIDYGPAEGYCMNHIKGKCSGTSTDCPYKQSEAPELVLDYVNSFY